MLSCYLKKINKYVKKRVVAYIIDTPSICKYITAGGRMADCVFGRRGVGVGVYVCNGCVTRARSCHVVCRMCRYASQLPAVMGTQPTSRSILTRNRINSRLIQLQASLSPFHFIVFSQNARMVKPTRCEYRDAGYRLIIIVTQYGPDVTGYK